MKFIGTKTHGYLDYLMGLLLIAAPWLFDFNRGGAETWVPVVLGAGMILYSLLTDYELGASRRIPMRTHLIFRILEIGAALFTKTAPDTHKRGTLHRTAAAH